MKCSSHTAADMLVKETCAALRSNQDAQITTITGQKTGRKTSSTSVFLKHNGWSEWHQGRSDWGQMGQTDWLHYSGCFVSLDSTDSQKRLQIKMPPAMHSGMTSHQAQPNQDCFLTRPDFYFFYISKVYIRPSNSSQSRNIYRSFTSQITQLTASAHHPCVYNTEATKQQR